jgi:hypothetical protein
MKTEWEKNEPFKRHIEKMTSFRRAHTHLVPVQQGCPDNGFPVFPENGSHEPLTVTPHPSEAPENLFTDAHGWIIVVPIWDVAVPKDSQN